MTEETVYKVAKDWKKQAFVDRDEYEKQYRKSVEKPDKFWGREGERIDWIKPYSDIVRAEIEKSAAQYAKEKGLTPRACN